MLKKFGLLLLLYLHDANAQVVPKIWHFGTKAVLDFNFVPPKVDNYANTEGHESNVTITDEQGKLLFYVTPFKIFNRNNTLMLNGDGLLANGGSSSQGPMVLQDPADPTRFYVFMTADETDRNYKGNLRYTIINMCGDNGLGSVDLQHKNIQIPGEYSERLTACPINNGSAYWILTSTLFEKNILAFYLDKNGINPNPVKSFTSGKFSPEVGKMKFNHAKNKLLYSAGLDHSENGVWLYDFDISTGICSNEIEIIKDKHCYGIEFSPNDQLIYYTSVYTISGLYQYEISSKIQTPLIEVNANYYVDAINEGPDGRLYICNGLIPFVSAILLPNRAGVSCLYIDRLINLASGSNGNVAFQNIAYFWGNAHKDCPQILDSCAITVTKNCLSNGLIEISAIDAFGKLVNPLNRRHELIWNIRQGPNNTAMNLINKNPIYLPLGAAFTLVSKIYSWPSGKPKTIEYANICERRVEDEIKTPCPGPCAELNFTLASCEDDYDREKNLDFPPAICKSVCNIKCEFVIALFDKNGKLVDPSKYNILWSNGQKGAYVTLMGNYYDNLSVEVSDGNCKWYGKYWKKCDQYPKGKINDELNARSINGGNLTFENLIELIQEKDFQLYNTQGQQLGNTVQMFQKIPAGSYFIVLKEKEGERMIKFWYKL